MSASSRQGDRSIRAIEALLRLRDIEDRSASVKVRLKQMEITRIQDGLKGLTARRGAVIRRGGAHVLRERLLLDALMKITLERGRELKSLKSEAASLLGEYREARNRRDAVSSLRDRRLAESEARISRRQEEAAGDAAATRIALEREKQEGEPCAD